MCRGTKKECVLSAISLKGCPIAVGLSQENKAYFPTATVTEEWMEILLCCVCTFITCHSQKSRENVTVQMWISGKVSAHLVLLKLRRDLCVESKSCGSAENILEVQKGCNRDILTACCSWMGHFFPSPSLPHLCLL